jgi:hypothetical protein
MISLIAFFFSEAVNAIKLLVGFQIFILFENLTVLLVRLLEGQ